ncbi:hypothetical protein D3A86_03885 [Vibrio cholerae]|nr:hypothetical protein [Vibrio cholerae]
MQVHLYISLIVIFLNSKQQTANSKQQTANSKQQTANSKQQTANSKQHLKEDFLIMFFIHISVNR